VYAESNAAPAVVQDDSDEERHRPPPPPPSLPVVVLEAAVAPATVKSVVSYFIQMNAVFLSRLIF